MRNVGAKMVSTEDRIANATKRIAEFQRKQKEIERKKREAAKKADERRNYILGELVSRYFPDVRDIEPGTKDENAERFRFIEDILDVLATDTDLMESVKERARQLES